MGLWTFFTTQLGLLFGLPASTLSPILALLLLLGITVSVVVKTKNKEIAVPTFILASSLFAFLEIISWTIFAIILIFSIALFVNLRRGD